MWNLLRLNPQSQVRYCEHVAENYSGIELYYPRFKRLSRPAGKRHASIVWAPVYPGYVFARVDQDVNSHVLIHTPIRAWFIRFGPEAASISSDVIDKLRILEAIGQLVGEKVLENPLRPGVKVVVHTPIADIEAIIVKLLGPNRVLVDTRIGPMSVVTGAVGVR